MRRFQDLSERDLDRLLDGKTPEGHDGLRDLAEFFAGVESSFSEGPDEATRTFHLAAITEAARTLAHEQHALPARRRPAVADRTTRRVAGTFSSLRRKSYALAAGLMVATGGLAAAGALPDAAQDALAAAAERAGFTLPSSGDEGRADGSLPEEADEVAHAVTAVTSSRDDFLSGKDFGLAVAAAARSAAASHREENEGSGARPDDTPDQGDAPSGKPAGVPPEETPEGNPTDAGAPADTPTGSDFIPEGTPTGAPNGQDSARRD